MRKEIIIFILIGMLVLSGCDDYNLEDLGLSIPKADVDSNVNSDMDSTSGLIRTESYSSAEMDKLMRACNLECCGEEAPSSCDSECRWPGYIECFHACDVKGVSNCDAECWPEHKKYFETTTIKCKNEKPLVGADKDEHGCIASAGYTWCEAKQKCIRAWEEDCSVIKEEVVTLSTTGLSMDLDNWNKIIDNQKWEKTVDGIKAYGAGYRLGHQGIYSKQLFDFANSVTDITWEFSGPLGKFASPWIFLFSDYVPEPNSYTGVASAGYFTVDHSWKESKVLDQNVRYFTRIKVESDGSYTSETLTADFGVNVIHTNSGEFKSPNNANIIIGFNDNYGGTETNVLVKEVKTTALPSGTNAIVAHPPVENALLIECISCCKANPEYNSDACEEFCTSHVEGEYPFWATSHQNYVDIVCQRAEEIIQSPTTLNGVFTTDVFPTAIAYDGSNMWVTANGVVGGTVTKYNLNGVVLGEYATGDNPDDVIYHNGYIWVANKGSDNVMKFDLNGELIGTYPVGDAPQELAVEGDNIWVANNKGGTVMKLSSEGENLLTYTAPGSTRKPVNILYAGTNIWIGNEWSILDAVSPSSGQTIPGYKTGGYISGLAYDGTDIYAVIWHDDVDLSEIRKYTTGWIHLVDFELSDVTFPSDMLYAKGYLWVTDINQNKLLTVDPKTGSIIGRYDTGDGPIDIGFDGTSIWVVNNRANTIQKI